MVAGFPSELADKKIAIVGASGRVGSGLVQYMPQNQPIVTLEHKTPVAHILKNQLTLRNLDICDELSVDRTVEKLAAMSVRTLINCSGDVSVDEAEKHRGEKSSHMYLVNVNGARNLARSCRKNRIKYIHISTEYVFDGSKKNGETYSEEDIPTLSLKKARTWYGHTKAVGEREAQNEYPNACIIRFSQVQSISGGLFSKTLHDLETQQEFYRASDQMVSPITAKTANTCLLLIEKALHSKNYNGVVHVSSTDAYTSYETCMLFAQSCGFTKAAATFMKPATLAELVAKNEQEVLRPYNSILNVKKFQQDFGLNFLHSVKKEIESFKVTYLTS